MNSLAVNTTFRHVSLSVPEKKYNFFMELVKSLKFVRGIDVEEEMPPSKEEILQSIADGIQQVKLHQQGKIKLKSAKELLDEL